MTRIIVTEWHRPADQIAEYVAMLRQEVEDSFYFCFSDGMVPGFGLIEDPAAYDAFQQASTAVEVEMTLEQAEQRTDWPLGARWNDLPIEDWGNNQRAGWYEHGVGLQKNGDVWCLPHVGGAGSKFRLVPV